MKQAIVVDTNANHRSTLMHQLSHAEFSSIFQFKTLAEAQAKLTTMTLFSGVLLLNTEGEAQAASQFLKYARIKHPNLCVIAVLDSISLAQMRILVGLGIDHVLIRPFNVIQLIEKIHAAQNFRNQVIQEDVVNTASEDFAASFERITDKYYKVSLRGHLIENCELPSIPAKSDSANLFVDCDHLKGLNSIGIRSWTLWFKHLGNQGFNHFEFDNFHPPILTQTSFVQGFLPTNSVVNSFYLYYWCLETNEEKEFRISFGKNYGTSQMRLPRFQIEKVGDQTRTYEIDENALKLLKFYTGTIEVINHKPTV